MDLCTEKLLSHRLRSFGEFEHCPSALEKACGLPVPYLEVDTRVTNDREIFLYHSPKLGHDVNSSHRFCETDSTKISQVRFANGEPLLTLDEALKIFKALAGPDQQLCVDIKDFGFEHEHLQRVRRLGLEDRVFFVSWIPQTLLRLNELGTKSPLILSHINLLKLRYIGDIVAKLLEQRIFRVLSFVLIGRKTAANSLGTLAHGYQHALVCAEIPRPLPEILSTSGGGICVNCSLVGKRLYDYCRTNNLKLWVFSTKSVGSFIKYARNSSIDVVFCDNASMVLDVSRRRKIDL